MEKQNKPAKHRPKRKIKNYLLNKAFQLKFVARIWLVMLISIVTISAAVFFATKLTVSDSKELTETVMAINRHAMTPQLAKTIAATTIIGLAVILVIFVTFTYFTHRVVGPLYRLSQCLEALIKKDLTQRAYLRKHDEFKDLALLYNQATEMLAKDMQTIKTQLSSQGQTAGLPQEETKKKLQHLLDQYKLDRL